MVQPYYYHRPSKSKKFFDTLILVAIALAVAWGIRTLVCEPYVVPTGSMQNTILIGDRVLAEKITPRIELPKQGEIITFESPEVAGRTLIKRCIALPGQTVDLKDGRVWVDGEKLDESYTSGRPSNPLEPAPGIAISYPYTLKNDEVWVMGDNRTNSADSRYFGPIKTQSISGHAFCIYWPLNHTKGL